jgi:hypothetical protein
MPLQQTLRTAVMTQKQKKCVALLTTGAYLLLHVMPYLLLLLVFLCRCLMGVICLMNTYLINHYYYHLHTTLVAVVQRVV